MSETRLFRLTWNTRGWEFPTGHPWKKENQGNRNIAWENQYGYGSEEWLFNQRFNTGGYQYGYIRGAADIPRGIDLIDKAYLFTIDKSTGERYLVGEINNLEIIHFDTPLSILGENIFLPYRPDMTRELKDAGADTSGFNRIRPTVRFKTQDSRLYDQIIPIAGLKGRQYNRYIPYIVDPPLLGILRGVLPDNPFIFVPGIARNTVQSNRRTSAATKAVIRLHGEITDNLAKYFEPEFSVARGNISVEKTKFGENTADVVLKHPDGSISILEAKTSGNQRKNFREAIGQLLDYALWHKDIKIKELIVVAPTDPGPSEKAQFSRVQEIIRMPLQYWYYQKGRKNIKDRFVKLL